MISFELSLHELRFLSPKGCEGQETTGEGPPSAVEYIKNFCARCALYRAWWPVGGPGLVRAMLRPARENRREIIGVSLSLSL